jgi:hypothetical protein
MRTQTLVDRWITFIFTVLVSTAPSLSLAEVVYEGWHKVLSAGQHVGYYVLRYDLDPKTKKFTQTSFLKSNAVGNDVMEALKAESLQVTEPNQWILPIKYQYTSTVGKKVKVIDAEFQMNEPTQPKAQKKSKAKTKAKEPVADAPPQKKQLRMVASITENGKTTKVDQLMPENTFLSSFLTYIILQSKEGLKVGNNYTYSAVAEEDAAAYEGTAFVKEETKVGTQTGFKVINEFKKIRFISILGQKGEILGTKSPLLSVATEPASSPAEAAGNIKIEEKTIRQLFGSMPAANKTSKTE